MSIKVVQRFISPLFAVIVFLLSVTLVVSQVGRGVAVEEGGGATSVASGGCWHQVQEGETLRSISRDYFGSVRYWRLIQQSNGADVQPASGSALWIPSAFGGHASADGMLVIGDGAAQNVTP